MALPAAGSPMSMSMINTELGDGTFDTIDLKAASTSLGESDAPFGMDELAGVSGTTAPSFSAFAASGGNGQIVITWTIANSPDSISLKVSDASNMGSPTEISTVNDGTHTQSSLGPAVQKFYQIAATNDGGTTNSSIVNGTTNNTSLASSPTTTNAFAESNTTTVGAQVGGLLTVTITNRSGNSTIARTTNTSGTISCAVSTSGDPGTNGTGNSGSGFLASHSGLNSDTLFIRPKFTEGGRNVTEGPTTNVITVTNNSVALNINVVCRSINLG